MNLMEVAKLVGNFFNWMKQILNAIGITEFDEMLDRAIAELLPAEETE